MEKRIPVFWNLLNKNSAVGKHFDAHYRSDGDTTCATPGEAKTSSYNTLIAQELQDWSSMDEDTYTVFLDEQKHRNMEVFYRLQKSGNCYLQAPILLHRHLSLWHDPITKRTGEVDFIHLSKYVRNTFPASQLYEYIINDQDGDSLKVAAQLVTVTVTDEAIDDCHGDGG